MSVDAVISSPLRGEDKGGGVRPIRNGTHRKARKLRNNLTDAEKQLWYYLRNKQFGVKFRRQQPIGKYIADFACLETKLVIELDGGQHAENSRDKTRDAFLKAEGFTVLRFWNNEVMVNMQGVLEHIAAWLEHPHPASPLKGEENRECA